VHRIHEVLVQVIHVFDDDVLEGSRHRHKIEGGQVLHQLAQSYPAGVRTDRNPELGR